ncbi:MAG: hypothetical protein JWO06_878 [Bacteroidota bacterium]|nr:hypothetical protein [Bacteroidota bacterium]
MKKIYLLSVAVVCVLRVNCQITVTASDFANPGETVVMSDATINQFLSYHTTGANSIWDYSTLQYNGQHIDTFYKETSANPFYILYFSNTSFNPHRSSMFITGGVTAPIIPLLPLTITNTENFLYKSSSVYEDQGFGADINGIPFPIAFTHPDVIYNFPIDYGNTDNSTSGYSINLPGTGYYGYQQTRTNKVDGWGTLTTPFGTFPAIRVMSEIASYDTFYINSVSQGIKIPRFKQREYKWIGNGQQEPLLQINTQVLFFNIETINIIQYRDSIHIIPVSGIDEAGNNDIAFAVYPNPANANFTVLYHPVNENYDGTTLTATDISGRVILSKSLTGSMESFDASTWARGMYFITVLNGNQRVVQKLVVQ